jgi:hypothetical protein
MSAPKAEFHNGLRILGCLDRGELKFLTGAQWISFARDPYRFFIRCDDSTADKIWLAMEDRL